MNSSMVTTLKQVRKSKFFFFVSNFLLKAFNFDHKEWEQTVLEKNSRRQSVRAQKYESNHDCSCAMWAGQKGRQSDLSSWDTLLYVDWTNRAQPPQDDLMVFSKLMNEQPHGVRALKSWYTLKRMGESFCLSVYIFQ